MIALLSCILMSACGDRYDLAPVSEVGGQSFSLNQRTHVVRKGETLYAIAFGYDTDYRQLAMINHLRAPYALRIGQVLNVRGVTRRAIPQRVQYRQSLPHKVSKQAAPAIIYTPTINSRSSFGWLWPARGHVAMNFVPEQGKKGINIACQKGEKVYAASSGVVAYSGSGLAGYGNLIIIKHNNEYLTAYGNNARNLVVEGQHVRSGQAIADVGVIDRRYWGVHFEIRKRGMPVNPLNYLRKN